MDTIPLETLQKILSYLPPRELQSSRRVNHYWKDAAVENHLWKRHCHRDWAIDDHLDDFHGSYVEHMRRFGSDIAYYASIRRSWRTIEDWLSREAPHIFMTLAPPATDREIEEMEANMFGEGESLPGDLRCSLRIHNGQLLVNDGDGLFGTYQAYSYRANIFLAPLESYKKPTRSKLLVIAFSTIGKKIYCSLNQGPSYGKIIELRKSLDPFKECFIVADSFQSLLAEHALNLSSNNYTMDRETDEICRYGAVNIPHAVTRGVEISCSPIFIPERSDTTTFFFAYHIRIWMSKERSASEECQLTMRHWKITNGHGNVEEVHGEGVVGFFPKMYPGAYFSYSSCCGLETPIGTMGGTFTFRMKESGEEFEAVVPEFTLRSYPIGPL